MKKKILFVLAISFVLCTCLLALTACGDKEPPHTHDYSTLKSDKDGHWYECECGDITSTENHNGGTSTCTNLAVCSVCNKKYGELEEHNHTALKYGETQHWYECVCGKRLNVENHNGGTAICTELAVCSVCNKGYGKLAEHSYATLKNNETQHWYECVCGDKSNVENHKGGNATCTEFAKCSVCNVEYGGYAPHPDESKWTYNETHHWHKSTCG